MAFERLAQRKFMQLRAAETLDMLRTPPGNRMEALNSKRKGRYGASINAQWRFCFRFKSGLAYDFAIEIVYDH